MVLGESDVFELLLDHHLLLDVFGTLPRLRLQPMFL